MQKQVMHQDMQKDVYKLILALADNMARAFGNLAAMHGATNARDERYTGIEGHGDYVHLMMQLNTLRLHVFQLEGAVYCHSDLTDQAALIRRGEQLKSDLDFTNDLYARL